MINPRVVIQYPVITEKATILREGNVYTFCVDPRANKIDIRRAVESVFDVRVKGVRTVSVPSKPKRQGVFKGSRAGWKKAYVMLREGDSIELIDNV